MTHIIFILDTWVFFYNPSLEEKLNERCSTFVSRHGYYSLSIFEPKLRNIVQHIFKQSSTKIVLN